MSKTARKETDGLIRNWIIERCNKPEPITLNEYNSYFTNSYERNYMLEYLDMEALSFICQHALSNITCTMYPTTYEEAIVTKLFPELLRRITHNSKSEPPPNKYEELVEAAVRVFNALSYTLPDSPVGRARALLRQALINTTGSV